MCDEVRGTAHGVRGNSTDEVSAHVALTWLHPSQPPDAQTRAASEGSPTTPGPSWTVESLSSDDASLSQILLELDRYGVRLCGQEGD